MNVEELNNQIMLLEQQMDDLHRGYEITLNALQQENAELREDIRYLEMDIRSLEKEMYHLQQDRDQLWDRGPS